MGSHLDGNWPYTGELRLAFNDDADSGNTSDNSGQVTATILVTHARRRAGTSFPRPVSGQGLFCVLVLV